MRYRGPGSESGKNRILTPGFRFTFHYTVGGGRGVYREIEKEEKKKSEREKYDRKAQKVTVVACFLPLQREGLRVCHHAKEKKTPKSFADNKKGKIIISCLFS